MKQIVAGLVLSLVGFQILVSGLLLLPVNGLSSLGALVVPYLIPPLLFGAALLVAGVVLLGSGVLRRARRSKRGMAVPR
jgi:hypothetical protein